MNLNFDAKKEILAEQYTAPDWSAGLSDDELKKIIEKFEGSFKSKAIAKAKTFEYIVQNARIAIDKDDIFQEKFDARTTMSEQKVRWEKDIISRYLSKENEEINRAQNEFGACAGYSDYGHTSPNSRLLLEIGFTGLRDRIVKHSEAAGLSDAQKDFYESCLITIDALFIAAKRLAEAIRPYNPENSDALLSITQRAPENIYEAMQLIVFYFFMHEYTYGTRLRTLGRLDVLLYPFYVRDIERGTFTEQQIREMLKYFLHKFWSAKVPFDLPFCLGGIDRDGNEVTNAMSYMIVEVYNSINIYSPKIHIRVSDKTPESFVKLVLDCIRGGNSSFVFVNDRIGIKSLMKVGIEERDARDYVPIGCYEPGVWGVEIACTGNGAVNLAKAVELVFTNGIDWKSGKSYGTKTGKISSYAEFMSAVKSQLAYIADMVCSYVTAIERHYPEINPEAILSCQYDMSVERGIDVYAGGAKYNNSSIWFNSIASAVDAICAVKKLVFEDKAVSFDELGEILKNNWEGHEELRQAALRLPEKYGNNNATADEVMIELTKYCAELVNNRPNGRGGVFKAAVFSIDHFIFYGNRTMATPDGRYAYKPLSKNMSATVGMDKKGITALISSVTKIDHSDFPNGSVLDILLHPSAVSGEAGLSAFYGILKTYMSLGGFALHGNVFKPEQLRLAQQNPEKYKNLQVRVCGWNAYFVNLSKVEQDAFIKQAEGAK